MILIRLITVFVVVCLYAGCGNFLRLKPTTTIDETRISTALSVNDNHPHAHYLAGRAALDKRQPGRALSHFRKAAALAPEFEEAWNGQGIAYLDMGSNSRALDVYTTMVGRFPNSRLGHEGVAVANLKLRKLDAAEAAAKKTLEIAPNSARANQVLGEVLYSRGELKAAVAAWKAAVALDGSLGRNLNPMIEDVEGYLASTGK